MPATMERYIPKAGDVVHMKLQNQSSVGAPQRPDMVIVSVKDDIATCRFFMNTSLFEGKVSADELVFIRF